MNSLAENPWFWLVFGAGCFILSILFDWDNGLILGWIAVATYGITLKIDSIRGRR